MTDNSLDRLRQDLDNLLDLAPLERVRAAGRLANRARTVLGQVGDEAVYEATRSASNPQVAAALGVSPSAVAHRIYRHHLATGVRLPPGGGDHYKDLPDGG